MKKIAVVLAMCLSLGLAGYADTVILSDGTSYSGQFVGAIVHFTDLQGIQYSFPRADVQTLVLNTSHDAVTLRNGKSYVGHFTGASPIGFTGAEGIKYQFPVRDVVSLVFNGTSGRIAPAPQGAKVVPFGTDLVVRAEETIDSASSQPGQLYRGVIAERVLDAAGNVAIPKGSHAQLLIRSDSNGGTVSSPELVLDLYSVTIAGKEYRVVTSDVNENNGRGVGKNRRTAEFLGGGAAIGALMGGIFGGGQGAGIGALSGAGGGMLTQVFTRGRQVRVPAESVLRFRLQRRLVLQQTM